MGDSSCNINNYIKCERPKYMNCKTENGRMDLKSWLNYTLSIRDSLKIYGIVRQK